MRLCYARPIEKGKRIEFYETETQTFLLNSYMPSRSYGGLTALAVLGGSSPRSISIGQLNALLHLHLRPIKLVVCK